MKINCIAIDDEPLALNLIAKFAEKIPYLQLLQTFESAYDALEILKTSSIDLVFLDVNMPDTNGIHFLKNLHAQPLVIFTTAYREYALDGFEMDAVDYLLKPFAFERFLKGVEKAYERCLSKQKLTNPPAPESNFIFVRSEYQMIRLDVNDILYVEGLKDYVKIYLKNQKQPILTLVSLKKMAEVLNPHYFVRVHNSFVVALQHVHSVRKSIVHIAERNIPIGEHYSKAFYELISRNLL